MIKNKQSNLLFTYKYENKILKQILFENRLERWLPGCVYPYTDQEHLSRYRWAAKFTHGKKVIDLACGCGKGSYILATKGKAKQVIACDNDKEALKYASLKYSRRNIKHKYMNAENLSLKNKSADAVISFETIEHLKKPKKFLKEVGQVLRTGGIFIVSTPISSMGYNRKPENKYHTQEWGRKKFIELIGKYFMIKDNYEQKDGLIFKITNEQTFFNYQIVIATKYESKINNTPLFIITSVINFIKSELPYSKTRSVFTPTERIIHTLETIKSIRKKVPEAKIMLLEFGKNSAGLSKLEKNVDEYIYLGNNPFVKIAVNGPHRGFGETLGLIFGYRYIKKSQNSYYYKISGRYLLNKNFDQSKWANRNKLSAKLYGEAISTRLYAFPRIFLARWFRGLLRSLPKLASGKMLEAVMYSEFKQSFYEMKEIGVSGKVAIDGSKIRE
jgi:ubiquinone/menaquinone biosynthesis C-methylase UbiE